VSSDSQTHETQGPDVKDYTATTIPVHIDLTAQETILNLSEAEEILRSATAIALGPCVCRATEQNCEAPIDTCLSLNAASAEMVANGEGFRYVDVDTALEALRASHRAGLVHLAYRKPGAEITEFCSCCSCCCWFLKELRPHEYRDAIVESSHVADPHPERCIGCGKCVQICPFDAWQPTEDAKPPTLVPERCFGCGVCVSACPANAIALRPRIGQ
jgi:Na+-translocating ferredoxin:NAD+ oxidoreductase subunit B